ncbi:hypothetical protein HanIR_Chr11g0536991 [Helianthus annuus]|nr:hypothetical protein HanIR_Chr11g0536991 [Helianthus annuus]
MGYLVSNLYLMPYETLSHVRGPPYTPYGPALVIVHILKFKTWLLI